MGTKLIICMGNVARGDDGAGHEVGERLRPLLEGRSAHLIMTAGLDIAMAEDVASASTVVIVDAERRDEPAVRVDRLRAEPSTSPTGHGIDPAGLLSLASSLYGATPPAYLVSVAGPEMEHSESLSPTAEQAVARAVVRVLSLLAESGPDSR